MSDIASASSEHASLRDFEDDETADEKRLRLAKEYLAEVREEDGDENIAKRLKKDVETHRRINHEKIADVIRWKEPSFLKGHKLPITCLAASPQDSNVVFTGGKDCVTIKWDLATGKKISFPGFRKDFSSGGAFDQILCVCAVDSNVVLSAGKDHLIRLWDTRTSSPKCEHVFRGHRDAVTCLQLNPDSQEFYSGSMDKTLRVWNLHNRTYVDTLYGHSEPVNDMDILTTGRPLTAGSDRTLRSWKVENDTHVVFQGHHTASVDCCSIIDHELMACGSQDGTIAVYAPCSKKPLVRRQNKSPDSWVTSLESIHGTDLLFSGAEDSLQAWKVERLGKKDAQLVNVKNFDVHGYVTEIVCTKTVCIAAVAKEHRFGRWSPSKANNGLVVLGATMEPEDT